MQETESMSSTKIYKFWIRNIKIQSDDSKMISNNLIRRNTLIRWNRYTSSLLKIHNYLIHILRSSIWMLQMSPLAAFVNKEHINSTLIAWKVDLWFINTGSCGKMFYLLARNKIFIETTAESVWKLAFPVVFYRSGRSL